MQENRLLKEKKTVTTIQSELSWKGTDNTEFDLRQYDSLIKLIQLLVSTYPEISMNRIIGHSDIAPDRKTDPGPFFDWSILNDII